MHIVGANFLDSKMVVLWINTILIW